MAPRRAAIRAGAVRSALPDGGAARHKFARTLAPMLRDFIMLYRAATVCVLILSLLAGGRPAAAQLQGRVEQHSFIGPVLGNTVLFNIYLPPGYDTSGARYPVVYFLHGLDGSQGGPSNTVVPRNFEQAAQQGIIGPVIIVFANGYLDSLWADTIDGTKPAETDVALQLVPHVDANFRTRATPCARAIMGFSMGGFGAPKFYTKFPRMFAASIAYDGSLADWDTIVQIRPDWAKNNFGNSQAYFQQYSPWFWAQANAAELSPRDDLRLVVALNLTWNRAYRDFLASLGITCDYVETGCPHDLPCMLNAQGMASAAFIAARLTGPLSGDSNADGRVDFTDLTTTLAHWGSPGPAGDSDQDGDVDFSDITAALAAFGAECL